ncbi:MAG TPA: single-stranded DNA-binding protein [Anaerolineae bacterium]|nr:single-stranded DNA-binding protein [Anaerolineae bacterium]
MSFHTVIIVGNLGRDPEMRYTPNGQAVTTLTVASNRNYTDANGQKIKETTWFRVSVWGKQAENCNTYLKKGSMVLIEGQLKPDRETGRPRIWTRADGSTGASYDIFARTVRFLSTRGTSQESYVAETEKQEISEDEIPF